MDWKLKDKKYVWHPFTQMQEYEQGDPVVIEEADGVRLIDSEGNEYYDGVSSLWVNVHGHQVDEIDEAIEDQLDEVAHSTLLGQGNVRATELAERLVEVTPDNLRKVFYSDSGATAVEIGMKMAIQYWANKAGEATERQTFLTFENGYHGDTFGPMSVVPDPTYHWPFQTVLPDPVQVPFPHVDRWPGTDDPETVLQECLDGIRSALDEEGERVAGIMVEPVQGAGGMITAPDGFLSGLRSVADEYDQLLIVDEVATGFGRTGELFACDHENVEPDIMPLGKGITGGYMPVAATMATQELYDEFLGTRQDKNALYHGHSYTGNALGCAAAVASLDLLEDRLDSLPDKIDFIGDKLDEIRGMGFVREVRQEGFMCGIELMQNPQDDKPFGPEVEAGWTVCNIARERGMLIRPLGDVVIFMPPLASNRPELEAMGEILINSLKEARKQLP
ncbi:MAG: adenosylmethionine--8-amino-7-oxononanoate transaminase [bacterium]